MQAVSCDTCHLYINDCLFEARDCVFFVIIAASRLLSKATENLCNWRLGTPLMVMAWSCEKKHRSITWYRSSSKEEKAKLAGHFRPDSSG